MPRLRKRSGELSIDELIQYFLRAPRYVHIDDKTMDDETITKIRAAGARPYLHFPFSPTPEDVHRVSVAYRARGMTFFDPNDPWQVYPAIPDLR